MTPEERAVSLFRQRNFSALWWGQLISLLGERLNYLAMVGLLAQHTSNFSDRSGSILLPLFANVMVAPVLLFAPFTGAWVDRWNLKRVLVISDLLRAGLVALIPLFYPLSGGLLPVFALVFLLFTCNVFFLPAKSAITPEIVPPSQLLAANAWLVLAGIIATALGALAGGWIIDHWGWSTALEINAVTYLASVVALAAIVYRPAASAAIRVAPPSMTWGRYLREVREGWSVVRCNPTVKLALVALGATWVAGGFLHVAGNQHVQRAASRPGMERIGVLLCALGIGSGLGTLWLNTQGRRWPRPLVLGAGLMIAGGGIVVFALSTRFAIFALASFLVGIAAAPALMLTETLIQQGTEPGQRGRVFSARDFIMRLLFVVGATLAGAISQSLGLAAALLACAGCLLLAGAIAFAMGRTHPELMRLEAEPPIAPPIGAIEPTIAAESRRLGTDPGAPAL